MPDIPDKVIEQAAERVYESMTRPGEWPPSNEAWKQTFLREVGVAGVIAAWARSQERERIREAIKARATEREAEMLEADRKASYKDSPDWAGIRDEKAAMSDELQSLLDDEPALTVLDRDGSDTREGEQ